MRDGAPIFWLNVVVLVPAALMLWRRPGRRRVDQVRWTGRDWACSRSSWWRWSRDCIPWPRSAPPRWRQSFGLRWPRSHFAVLIRAETRHRQPLVDLGVFSLIGILPLASGLVFLLMFDIMTFLLYFNFFAQSADGLGMSAVGAGLALVPLSIALFGFARAAPWLAGRRRCAEAADRFGRCCSRSVARSRGCPNRRHGT